MGLLDEAIREHLELKRRRGADPTEVSRQEQEAFGPARRGELVAEAHPEPALDEPATFAEQAPPAEEPPTQLRAVADPHAHELQDEPPRPHGDPADALPHLDPQATQAFDADEVRAATAPAPAEPVAAEPEPEPEPARPELAAEPLAPAPPPPPAPVVPEPEPVVPEPAPRAEETDPAEEDVLEETPEFLQETPEHDRLWFEQRPPRDFDF